MPISFNICFSPVRGDRPLTLAKQGAALVIDGEVFDFAPLPEGATLPRRAVDCPALASDVERSGDEICLTLRLPHGVHAPQNTRFPAPVTVDADGPVSLPPFDQEQET